MIADVREAKTKLQLPSLMGQLELGEHAKRSARCPFHDDRSNSFSVWQNRSGWFFKCHAGCGEGDEINFLEVHHRISRAEATKLFLTMASADCHPQFPIKSGGTKRGAGKIETKATLPYWLSDTEVREAVGMINALKSQPELCERIATARGWKLETICKLAAEMALGWHDGKLAFIYESGVKLRWRKEGGERIITWAFGKPWLWRGSFLFDGATTAYITEGETDCISLIDAGVENDSDTRAVAIPSASTFDRTWAELFDNKNVILAFDGDEAGLKATAKVSALLRSHVRTLKQLNWEGVRYANAR